MWIKFSIALFWFGALTKSTDIYKKLPKENTNVLVYGKIKNLLLLQNTTAFSLLVKYNEKRRKMLEKWSFLK